MSSGAKLTKEILIVGTGMAFAVASAIIASMMHSETIPSVLGVLYSLLMSAMYYIWFPLLRPLHFVRYTVLCAVTGYILGFLEITFLS
jgi:hypothetical protein